MSHDLDEKDRESFARAARTDVGPLRRGYRIIFDRRLSDDVAVVAAQADRHSGPGAKAFVLVRDGDAWFVAPNFAQLVYGESAVGGTSAAKPVVDFQVLTSGERPRGRLWLDDQEVRVREEPDPTSPTFRADIGRLERRLYSVVAFAEVGDRRGAIAWTFHAE